MDRVEILINRWKVACENGDPQEKFRAATVLYELEEKSRGKMWFSCEEQLYLQEARMFLGK